MLYFGILSPASQDEMRHSTPCMQPAKCFYLYISVDLDYQAGRSAAASVCRVDTSYDAHAKAISCCFKSVRDLQAKQDLQASDF